MKPQIWISIIVSLLAVSLVACGAIGYRGLPTGQSGSWSVSSWHKAGCSASSSISQLKRGQYPSTPTPAQKEALCE